MRSADLAKLLDRHPNTIRAWAKADLIPCRRRNARVIVFDLDLVRTAMEKQGLKLGPNPSRPQKHE